MKDLTYHKLERFVEFCIKNRVAVLAIFTVLTLVMTFFATRVQVRTVFGDLLPQSHPYVKVHERFRQDFGGST